MEFKVKDRVKVINNGYTYSTNETWMNKHALSYKKKWKRIELPSEDEKYTIVVKAPHGTHGTHATHGYDVYLIQDIKTKQVYMIGNKGLELVKENKTFFKRLPNDYTGTIEVENGYIVEKEILDEEEKEYLNAVIRPFRDRVVDIEKRGDIKEYIVIIFEVESIVFPFFEKDTMYKGMETNRAYTLKELGLDE